MKPPNENGGPKTAARIEPAKAPDALGELVNFLKGQWLRHDVLHRALGNEADRLAALRFARFADAAQQARCDLLPPWLKGNELFALGRKGKKEVQPCL
jgi:hypothetical protein